MDDHRANNDLVKQIGNTLYMIEQEYPALYRDLEEASVNYQIDQKGEGIQRENLKDYLESIIQKVAHFRAEHK